MNESLVLWRVCMHVIFMWTQWVWDPFTLQTHCKQTVNLLAVLHSKSPFTSSAAASVSTSCTWTVSRFVQYLWPWRYNCRDSCLMNMMATHTQSNQFRRKWLPNISCRTSKMTFTVCRHLPSCWKKCPHALLPQWPHLKFGAGTFGLVQWALAVVCHRTF